MQPIICKYSLKKISLHLQCVIVALMLFFGSSVAMACDGCDCGNGTFKTGHCCKSNGDCVAGDVCSVGLCEMAIPQCSSSVCTGQSCGKTCIQGGVQSDCDTWCGCKSGPVGGNCCSGGQSC